VEKDHNVTISIAVARNAPNRLIAIGFIFFPILMALTLGDHAARGAGTHHF
jgi:hypothetical protein